jgi:hypothetical protein
VYARREGAFIWPEVSVRLGEQDWIARSGDPDLDRCPRRNLDPHHLRWARRALTAQGMLRDEPRNFGSGITVPCLVYVPALESRGRKTEVERRAAHKRRLYHRYLAWTQNPDLCGRVAEKVTLASLRATEGLVVDPALKIGHVRELEGRRIEAGPLDAAGHVVTSYSPMRSVPFGVEVKNVREMLYPKSLEVWDLLGNIAPYPDVLPMLVTRRLHYTAYKMLEDLGVFARYLNRQWFAKSIDGTEFAEVCSEFGFRDAERVEDPREPHPAMVKAFRDLPMPASRPEAEVRLARWREAAPIVERYGELRDLDPTDEQRDEVFNDFRKELTGAELSEGGW